MRLLFSVLLLCMVGVALSQRHVRHRGGRLRPVPHPRPLVPARARVSRPVQARRPPAPGLSGLFSNFARRFAKNYRFRARARPLRPANHQRRRNFQQDKTVPNFYYKKAEDMPGYEKFTLDEVVVPDQAARKSDDVKEDELEFVDDVKKEEDKTEKKE